MVGDSAWRPTLTGLIVFGVEWCKKTEMEGPSESLAKAHGERCVCGAAWATGRDGRSAPGRNYETPFL